MAANCRCRDPGRSAQGGRHLTSLLGSALSLGAEGLDDFSQFRGIKVRSNRRIGRALGQRLADPEQAGDGFLRLNFKHIRLMTYIVGGLLNHIGEPFLDRFQFLQSILEVMAGTFQVASGQFRHNVQLVIIVLQINAQGFHLGQSFFLNH